MDFLATVDAMASATWSAAGLAIRVDTAVGTAAASDMKLDEAVGPAATLASEAAEVSPAGSATGWCGPHSH